ncbi:transmembrane protein 256 homolog isoform X3 [Ostrea edulis]|uniref:transmembrane protein 256 homolog isoform X3 n=1 Tax=Ostrea edulis TaxID=37623 RepID=UPI0024AF9460|nr:transmembrane protein 256 homolog isoform X3 [Ostrea edulis]
MGDVLSLIPPAIIDNFCFHAVKKIGDVLSSYFSSNGKETMTLHGSRLFLRLGAVSGAVALSMAAYGAHAFNAEDENGEQLKKIYKTGHKVHLVQSVALVCSPLCNRPNLIGSSLCKRLCIIDIMCTSLKLLKPR